MAETTKDDAPNTESVDADNQVEAEMNALEATRAQTNVVKLGTRRGQKGDHADAEGNKLLPQNQYAVFTEITKQNVTPEEFDELKANYGKAVDKDDEASQYFTIGTDAAENVFGNMISAKSLLNDVKGKLAKRKIINIIQSGKSNRRVIFKLLDGKVALAPSGPGRRPSSSAVIKNTQSTRKAAMATKDIPVKRGVGRPKNVESAKRAPGRPRKNVIAAVAATPIKRAPRARANGYSVESIRAMLSRSTNRQENFLKWLETGMEKYQDLFEQAFAPKG